MIVKNNNSQRNFRPALLLALFIFFLASLFSIIPESLAEVFPKSGIVITRGLVLGANDKPIFAEINEGGEFVNDIGEAVDDYEKARVISGDSYRGLYEHYQQHLQAHEDDNSYRGAKVMTAEEYNSTNLGNVKVPKVNWDGQGQSYTEVSIPKIDLPDFVKSVLVRNSETIVDPNLLPPGDGSILFRSTIDLRKGVLQDLSSDIRSVLIGDKGKVLYQSSHNIGFKAAFYTDSQGNPHDTARRDPQEDTILGPVSGAKVEPTLGYSMGPTYTDEDGKFLTNFRITPCPGFAFNHHFYFEAVLFYRNYDPEALNPLGKYYFKRDYYHYCSGYHLVAPGLTLGGLMAQVNAIGMHASRAIPYNPVEIYVDVVQLGGLGQIVSRNGIVEIGDTTEYEYVPPPGTKVKPSNLDLDNDRNYDTVTQNGDSVGVYLGDKQPVDENGQPVEPDLVKVADTAPDWNHQGLLKGISEADFKETDLYFYRASNGVLITKIESLDHTYKIQDHDPRKVGISRDEHSFHYRVRIPGEWATKNTWLPLSGTREEWQEALETPPELSGREFDALRPGENIKIIAINRPTGYIGTRIATIQPAGQGFLDFNIPPILMQAPNLKIKAERAYTVEAGLTKDEKRDYTIGFEGAALTSDTMISIKTEWFDHDGTPLPEDLEGYTGRLAKVVSANSVEGGEVQQFKIEPGEHLELLKFKGDILGTEHFYVHVSGYPEWRSAGEGAGAGPLQYRPKNYVPFMVPILNEVATREERNKVRYAREDGLSDIEEVDPIYHWPYRPEMQFSVFDFLAKEIEIQNESGDTETIKLDSDSDPDFGEKLLADDTDIVSLLYSLKSGQFGPLPTFGGVRQLILAIGAEEVLATIGGDGKVNFQYSDHLSKLGSADMLTIRLYQNSDAENILWEYAFLQLDIAVDLNRDGKVEFAAQEYTDEEETEPTDKTTPERPFRFWINDDMDVVNHAGERLLDRVSCQWLNPNIPANGEDQYEQDCEQWDESTANGHITNTSSDNLTRIESIRDLEDLFPMSIRFISEDYSPKYYMEMKAVGVGVNIFKGVWDDAEDTKAHAWIYNEAEAQKQTLEANGTAGHVVTLQANGQARKLTKPFLDEYFDEDGIGRFIVEGTSPCEDGAECYLEISFWEVGKEKPLAKRELYLSLQKVNEYYETWTAGTAEPSGFGSSNWGGSCIGTSPGFVPQGPVAIHTDSSRSGDNWIYSGVLKENKEEKARKNRAILVHGWRMRDSEKQSFADTTFKRLYWLGYQGEFATVTWPTGWFYKPAHCYISAAVLAGQHPQNYDQSEVVARLTGQQLERWLVSQGGSGKKLHLIAHSMGNVVVSEALRHHQAGQLVESYSASQAAEVGGSYEDALGDMTHNIPFLGERDPFVAWQYYNTENDHSSYGMPPDIYRYTNLIKKWGSDYFVQHRKTSTEQQLRAYSEQLKNGSDIKTHYYSGIAGKAGRIINLFNTGDAALTAWEFNQLSKPDAGLGPDWGREWEDLCKVVEYDTLTGEPIAWEYPDGASCPEPETHTDGYEKVSRFYRDGVELAWNPELPSGAYTAEQHNYLHIMGHFIPARTESLGQVDISLADAASLVDNTDEFTTSNQGHSAQFHGYLSEPGRGRINYWQRVMEQGFRLNPYTKGHYSGLHPNVGTR